MLAAPSSSMAEKQQMEGLDAGGGGGDGTAAPRPTKSTKPKPKPKPGPEAKSCRRCYVAHLK